VWRPFKGFAPSTTLRDRDKLKFYLVVTYCLKNLKSLPDSEIVGRRPWQAKLNMSVSAASLRDRGKAELLHSDSLLPKKPKNQCLPVK